MIRSISKSDVARRCCCGPLNYASYLKWLENDADSGSFHIASTCNVNLFPRDSWERHGRELHDRGKVIDHAQIVADALAEEHLAAFIARHEVRLVRWFPSELQQVQTVENALKWAKCNTPGIDPHSFDGGWEIDGEVRGFLAAFIDYPFLLRYSNIDLVCCQVDLIVKITHHLDVQFISHDRDLVGRIARSCQHRGCQNVIIPSGQQTQP